MCFFFLFLFFPLFHSLPLPMLNSYYEISSAFFFCLWFLKETKNFHFWKLFDHMNLDFILPLCKCNKWNIIWTCAFLCFLDLWNETAKNYHLLQLLCPFKLIIFTPSVLFLLRQENTKLYILQEILLWIW